MKITLKKLKLHYFKGIKDLVVDFTDDTTIMGANGTGKSTVADAWTWLLFGKDTTDRKDFNIKTLDEKNKVIPETSHFVYAEIEVDGKSVSLKRTYDEKWTKPRGSAEYVFSGNTSSYFWNEVEVKASEFAQKVNAILDEKTFKLITSPTAFPSLHWQEKRQVLTAMAGDVSDDEIATENEDFTEILSYCIGNNISIDERLKQLKASVKRMSDEQKSIPARIDEVYTNMPEKIDEADAQKSIAEKESEIAAIDAEIQDASRKNEEIIKKKQKRQNDAYEISKKISALEFSLEQLAREQHNNENSASDQIRNQISALEAEINGLKNNASIIQTGIKGFEAQIQKFTEKRDAERAEWHRLNKTTFEFDPKEAKCPTCGHEISGDDLDAKVKEMEAAFNEEKQRELQEISKSGKQYAEWLTTAKENCDKAYAELTAVKVKISDLETEASSLKGKLDKVPVARPLAEILSKLKENSKELSALKSELSIVEGRVIPEVPTADSTLISRRKNLFDEIVSIKEGIAQNRLIDKSEERIQELKDQESTIAQSIAKCEREAFIIEQFKKAKIDRVEAAVNGRFSYVKFKMFEQQQNGGEAETCEILINGVPYADANTASKINAGIDIINALSTYYKTFAPIIIDNRESVTNILPTQSQVVNLVVNPEYKKLTIK